MDNLEFKKNKDLLSIDVCPICLENINLDLIVGGIPQCIICKNGHRCHRDCYMSQYIRSCPICRETEIFFCKTKLFGYLHRRSSGKYKRKRKTLGKKIGKGKIKVLGIDLHK